VIAKGDVKLRHLARNPRCVLVAFEAVRPFRGVEARGEAEPVEGDVTSARVAITGRYLGVEDGERFAADRRSRPGGAPAARPRQSTGLGPIENPAFLIDSGQHRPTGRGWCLRLGQLGVACLGIQFCVGCALIIRLIIQRSFCIRLEPGGFALGERKHPDGGGDPSSLVVSP